MLVLNIEHNTGVLIMQPHLLQGPSFEVVQYIVASKCFIKFITQ